MYFYATTKKVKPERNATMQKYTFKTAITGIISISRRFFNRYRITNIET